jgi:hypothetical protein
VALPWLSPFISELFDCVESYNTALHEERMTVHTGNSSLERMFEPRRMDMNAVALDRLPRNWYDEEWYKARSASGRTMLSARKDVPIPTLVCTYCNTGRTRLNPFIAPICRLSQVGIRSVADPSMPH